MRTRLFGMLALVSILSVRAASAAPIMFVHDSTGDLGTVDVVNGDVNMIGNMGVTMTDIAFDPTGNLFGVSFGAFYSINPTTAVATLIGDLGSPTGMNALVFATDGTLYAAANNSTNLFTINPATGASSSLGSMNALSGGDLAFNSGNLYLATSSNQLHLINLANLSGSSTVGPFGVNNVFGLATGDDGVLYGVAGTQIFTVDPTTGAATNPVNFGGQGLGQAFGQSFFTEAGAPPPAAVPEPASLLLLGGGLTALASRRRRRKTTGAQPQ